MLDQQGGYAAHRRNSKDAGCSALLRRRSERSRPGRTGLNDTQKVCKQKNSIERNDDSQSLTPPCGRCFRADFSPALLPVAIAAKVCMHLAYTPQLMSRATFVALSAAPKNGSLSVGDSLRVKGHLWSRTQSR